METRHDPPGLAAVVARLEAVEQAQAHVQQAMHQARRRLAAELAILRAATTSARRAVGTQPDHLLPPGPVRVSRRRVAMVSVRLGWGRGRRSRATVVGLRIASMEGYGVYAESRDAAAVVASSLNAQGVHAVGGGVRGGLGASPGPCGVFAEGGTGDGVYATSKAVALHGVSPEGYGASLAGGTAPLHLVPATTPGAPTEGEHRQGALFVDMEGTLWFCIASGTPGTWRQIVVQ